MKTYFKYALCLIRHNRLLVLEEADNAFYLMPGGRPVPGETCAQTLHRELKEELGIALDIKSLNRIGTFEDVAAGDASARVKLELYTGDFHGDLTPRAEVKRLVWFGKDDDQSRLAPVTRNKILPALRQEGLLSW